MNAQDIIRAVMDKTGLDPVKITDEPHNLRIVGRLLTNQQVLLELYRHLNNVTREGLGWTVDTSKWYFTLPDTEQRYAWRIIFQSDGVLPYDQIVQHIYAFRQPTDPVGGGPLEEIRLGAATANRNIPNKLGKGAAPMGKARVGKAFTPES